MVNDMAKIHAQRLMAAWTGGLPAGLPCMANLSGQTRTIALSTILLKALSVLYVTYSVFSALQDGYRAHAENI